MNPVVRDLGIPHGEVHPATIVIQSHRRRPRTLDMHGLVIRAPVVLVHTVPVRARTGGVVDDAEAIGALTRNPIADHAVYRDVGLSVEVDPHQPRDSSDINGRSSTTTHRDSNRTARDPRRPDR